MSFLDTIVRFRKFLSWPPQQPVADTRNRQLNWILIGALVFTKLWLVADQPLFALADNSHDDLLFVRLANYLTQFQWLGPYNNLTLAKGPFYPMWIALAFLAGVPLLLSQQLLYIAACLVTERALQPLIASRLWRTAILILLLFNPATFTWQLTRVLRDGLYPGLALLVVGSAIGLLARRHEPAYRLAGWAVTCGLATAAFWLTREEGIWILPFLAPVLIWTLAVAIFATHRDWRKIVIVALPILLPLLAIQAVSMANLAHYGIYATVEFKTPEFKSAYGALTRVQPAEHKSQVPVTKETRLRIYQASPAFAELRPFFERSGFWTLSAVGFRNHPSGPDEIGGGWFMWALRDAAAGAGYFGSGPQAAGFFQRLADEVNTACQDKRLDCLPERASLMPPWRPEYLMPVINKIISGFGILATFSGVSPDPVASNGSSSNLLLFQDLTREQPSRPDIKARMLPQQARLEEFKRFLLQQITMVYRLTIPYFVIITLVAITIWLFQSIRNRTFTVAALIATSVAIALCVRLVILAIIDITSFPGMTTAYLSPLYPILMLGCSLFIVDAINAVKRPTN